MADARADFIRKEFAMIATHNIKVNGRWVRAGEEYQVEQPVTPKKAETPKVEKAVEEPQTPEVKTPEVKAEQKTESKAKTPARRKKISE